MGDGETPLVAELRALQQAKRTAVEQAGTYVQSYSKAKNYELTADEIETVSAGIIEVEVLEKNRRLVGKGLQFFVKIKATVTVDKADELVSRLRQKSPDDVLNRESEYKKLKDGYAQLETEIYTLKRQMAESKNEQERQRTIRLIAEQERKYQARELYGRCQVSMMSIQFSGSDKPMAGYKDYVACLDEVIRLDPSFADAWGMRGIYREAIGQREGSIDDYTEAIRLDPQSDRYLARGQAFERFNKPDRALMDAHEAIRLDLNAANLYQWRGGLYYFKGSYSNALIDFTDAILFNSVTYSGDPALATIALAGHYADRGLTYGQLGQHQAAIDDFTKAAKLVDSPMVQSEYPLHFKKKKSLVLYDRAKSYGLLKRDDEAVRDYRQACTLGNVLGCDALKGR
jgi:tetratricopeptide (TPR) repeat protein